jgi:hypothetical protein
VTEDGRFCEVKGKQVQREIENRKPLFLVFGFFSNFQCPPRSRRKLFVNGYGNSRMQRGMELTEKIKNIQ